MSMITTKELTGITSFFTYENGGLQECRLSEYNEIVTEYGVFIPQYKRLDVRKKDGRALSFHKNGRVKSIALEEQTEVTTSLGVFPAELLTFYETGELDSIFPLNGQISFSWSEEEEGALAIPYTFQFPFGNFETKIIGLRFYPSELVRSLILWPGETIKVETAYGCIPVRIGFKLYESGGIESVEPAEPIAINTPIGIVKAYDPLAYGIDADFNSLRFHENGTMHSLITTGSIWIKNTKDGITRKVYSKQRPGLTEEDMYFTPIKLTFEENVVLIEEGRNIERFLLSENEFRVEFEEEGAKKICYGDCSKCAEHC